MMHGYDDDPRGLWEIPEVPVYLCRWAQFAGLHSSADADRFRIDENMCAVLAKCGVFDDPQVGAALTSCASQGGIVACQWSQIPPAGHKPRLIRLKAAPPRMREA
jgi:hypothetical protein